MAERKHRWAKRAGIIILVIATILVIFSVWFHHYTKIDIPLVENSESVKLTVENPFP